MEEFERKPTLRYVCIKDLRTATRLETETPPLCPICRIPMTAVPPEKLLRSPSEWKKKGLYKN